MLKKSSPCLARRVASRRGLLEAALGAFHKAYAGGVQLPIPEP